MKLFRLPAAVIALVILLASLAWSQDAVMSIKSEEVRHQRGPVKFTHEKHEAFVDCKVCHHDFYVFAKRSEPEGTKCQTCHQPADTKANPLVLRRAYHQRCTGCHLSQLRQDKPTGPVICGQCHQKP